MKKLLIDGTTRKISKDKIVVGYLQENKIEKLEFEIPEEYKTYGRKACFKAQDKTFAKIFDDITSDTLTLTRDMTQYDELEMSIAFFKTENEDEIVARTSILKIYIENAIICDDDISPDEPKIIILDKLIDEVTKVGLEVEKKGDYANLQGNYAKEQGDYAKSQGDYAKEQKIEVVKANEEANRIINNFETNVGEYTTSFNENANNKTTHFDSNAESKTSDFNQNVDNKISEYNNNASEKLSAYNTNAENKKNEFDTNVANKTKTFNDNASSKLESYNQNDTTKTNTFNDNATNKTNAFNSNANSKTKTYNNNHTEKLNAYNTNATSKLNDYNTNASAKLQEYNDNATQKIEEYDAHSEELNNKVVSTRNELERVKNDILETGTASDSFINVQDSAMAELQELSVDGVCEQNTTTGKNKFDKNNPNLSPENYNLNDNGELVSAGSWYVAQYLEVIPDTTYTLSGSRIPNTWMSRISQYDANKNHIVQQKITNTKNVFTFTTESTAKYISFNLFKDVMDLSTIQLEQGSTATSYEPYTGGQPSPSPDYPQEISVLTGDIKLTSCGKNLFDKNDLKKGFRIGSDGTYFHDNDYSASASYIRVKPNTNYYILFKYIIMETVAMYDKNYKFVRRFSDDAHIFTTTDNEYYILTSVLNDHIDLQQIEIGNKASSYEDYMSSKIEANLPEGEFIGKFSDTNKDYVSLEYNKEEGQYHAVANKYIKKFILDGTENWYKTSDTINVYTCNIKTSHNADRKYTNSRHDFICNRFSYLGDAQNENLGNAMSFNISKLYVNAIYIQVDSSIASSISELKTWLSTHPTEVYYLTNQPYKIDLGPIDMPLSYNEVTNIFTDSGLLPKINAKYYRNFITTVQNLQVNEKALKQELADINTRLTALESANASVTSESEVTE